eukprot:5605568-Prymnesium_polylepis.1
MPTGAAVSRAALRHLRKHVRSAAAAPAARRARARRTRLARAPGTPAEGREPMNSLDGCASLSTAVHSIDLRLDRAHSTFVRCS